MGIVYLTEGIILRNLKFFYASLGLFLCLCACSANSDKTGGVTEAKMDDNQKVYFWDTFDFADTMMLEKPEVMEKMLVDYLTRLPYLTDNQACESIRELVLKTKANCVMNHWFLQQLEHYLYEPDSPLRNDEYYIAVLEEALSSGCWSGMMRVRPSYQLKMLRKNRTGTKATDFTIVLPTGKVQNLWDISAKRTLLLFYDPNCEHCREVIRELSKSGVINAFLSRNKELSLVTVCVEGDMETWKEFLPFLPPTWVNGFDAKNVLTEKEVYLLRSFPSMYLLGEDKQVLLKEPTVDEILICLLKKDDSI